MAQAPAPDKRRAILDAAITVFARQGFHSARVLRRRGRGRGRLRARLPLLRLQGADAQRALLGALGAAGRGEPGGSAERSPPRDKLAGVANFIIESYRHEPELMKVIIVEVTRAANSFGRTHLPEIRQAYDLVAEIVSDAQEAGEFRDDVDPNFAAMVVLRSNRAVAHRLDLRLDPVRRRGLRARQAARRRDHLRRPGAPARHDAVAG